VRGDDVVVGRVADALDLGVVVVEREVDAGT
jgi:hypothetical protein